MKEKSKSNHWLLPAICTGIVVAVLIASGAFLISMRRKDQWGY